MMVNRRGQTSMPHVGFESTDSASKRSGPTPQTAQSLGLWGGNFEKIKYAQKGVRDFFHSNLYLHPIYILRQIADIVSSKRRTWLRQTDTLLASRCCDARTTDSDVRNFVQLCCGNVAKHSDTGKVSRCHDDEYRDEWLLGCFSV
jgi:hypothetical protein